MSDITESEKWLTEQIFAGLLVSRTNASCPKTEAHAFSKSLWPFMEPYLSPLYPTYSFEIGSAEAFSSEKLWMLRDGAIPLAWFFKSVPEDRIGSSSILVHASLSPLVPESWRPHTKYFELYAAEYFNKAHPPEKIFLTGPVHASITSIDELDATLDDALAFLDFEKLKEVMVYCPVRQLEHAAGEEENFEFQFYHRIFTRFGPKARFLHWNVIERSSYQNTAVVDLSAGWICKDSSMVHHLLSRGAGLLGDGPKATDGQASFPLSRYHGLSVTDSPAKGGYRLAENSKELLAFYSALHKVANSPQSRFPWPKWFHGFSRSSLRKPSAEPKENKSAKNSASR